MNEQAREKLRTFALRAIHDDVVNTRRAEPRSAAGLPAASAPRTPEPLDLVVIFRDEAAGIERLAAGMFVAFDPAPATGLRECSGLFPPENLDALIALPNVISVREPESIRPTLDYSVPETRATDLRSQFPWMTGLGVLIVTIDIGIEWRHGAFNDAGGKTRIRKLWDLTRAARPGETAGLGMNGVVFTDDDIDNHRPIDSKDEGAGGNGHGSIVAGIAAGNGAPATCTCFGCCHSGGTYVGIAPEADIIAVRVNTIAHLVVALALLPIDPDVAGRRVVVNISMGTNDGPHDGTHRLEQAIDRFAASGPTRFVVVAAGNSAGLKQHVSGLVPRAAAGPGTLDVPVHTRRGDATTNSLVFYHLAIDLLNVQVISPSGAASAIVSTNGVNGPVVNGVTFAVNGTLLTNGDTELRITATGPGAPLAQDGNWIIRFSNAGAHDVQIDAWVPPALPGASWRFLGQGEQGPGGLRATDLGTITTPATARSAIAVGNYQNRTSFCNFWWSGDIDSNSGRGPARRDVPANPNPKPTIAAPGTGITAPKYDACNLRGNLCSCCPDWLTALYDDDSGTSMAAPHVTGAIALMLQVNATLTQAEALRFLHDSARPAPGPVDRNTWGSGKLDVNAAVALALQDALPPSPEGRRVEAIGGAGATPARRAAALDATSPPPQFTLLVRSLRASPNGELVAALVSRNFSEARRLVNAHPTVATMWHRAGGPALLRELAARGGTMGDQPLLRDAGQREYFRRFLDQVHRFASPRLAATIEQHSATILAALGADTGSA